MLRYIGLVPKYCMSLLEGIFRLEKNTQTQHRIIKVLNYSSHFIYLHFIYNFNSYSFTCSQKAQNESKR